MNTTQTRRSFVAFNALVVRIHRARRRQRECPHGIEDRSLPNVVLAGEHRSFAHDALPTPSTKTTTFPVERMRFPTGADKPEPRCVRTAAPNSFGPGRAPSDDLLLFLLK